MNLIKATVAAAAVVTCCLGNEMPARSDSFTCMDLGPGYTTCSGSGGSHTFMDLSPRPLDMGLPSLDEPFDSGIRTCSTFGSTTTCF